MKVRITKNKPGALGKVGDIFEVIDGRKYEFPERPDNGYYVAHPNNSIYELFYVSYERCEIVNEESEESSAYTSGPNHVHNVLVPEYDFSLGAHPEQDVVNSPPHYTQGGVEVIDIIAQTVSGYDDPFVSYNIGNVVKYISRAPYKHAEPTEDLRKAKRYIEFAIDHLTKEDD